MEARYLRIAESLEAEIRDLAPNTLLASEPALARRFGVSRVTVRRALGILERAGRLSRQRGRGTIVNPPKLLRRPLAFTLDDDLRRQATRLDSRLLRWEPELDAPAFVRSRLALGPSATVQFLSLLRVVDERIVAHEARYFALPVAKRLDPGAIGQRPVSALVAELVGVPITRLDWEIEIVPAPREIAEALSITPGGLIVASHYTQHLETGWLVETGVVSYRIDHVRFCFSSDDAPWLVHPNEAPRDGEEAAR